jgi:hypothetical protein
LNGLFIAQNLKRGIVKIVNGIITGRMKVANLTLQNSWLCFIAIGLEPVFFPKI